MVITLLTDCHYNDIQAVHNVHYNMNVLGVVTNLQEILTFLLMAISVIVLKFLSKLPEGQIMLETSRPNIKL
jgi:hypothetical protein